MSITEIELENAFGPLDAPAVLAADEARKPWRAGQDVVTECAIGAACVPARLGGGWTDAYGLMRLLRPVFRRDVTTGLTLLTGVLRPGLLADEIAPLLLAGGTVAYADDGLPARGPVVIANSRTGSALVAAVGGRTVVRDEIPAEVRQLTLSACRGLDLATTGLIDGPGRPQDGWAHVASAVVCAGAAVGTLDTCLRLVLDFALHRELYGTKVVDLPHARGLLAGAYVDLRMADLLVSHAADAVDQRSDPGAVPYLVPRLLAAAARDLATVLGARFYLRRGPYALFGKCLRDLAMVRLLCDNRRGVRPDALVCQEIATADWARARLRGVDDEARPPLPEDVADELLPELLTRHRDGISFDANEVWLALHTSTDEE